MESLIKQSAFWLAPKLPGEELGARQALFNYTLFTNQSGRSGHASYKTRANFHEAWAAEKVIDKKRKMERKKVIDK